MNEQENLKQLMKHNIQNVPLLVEVTERYLVVSPFSTPLCESNFTCDQFCIYVDVLQAVLQIEIVRNDVSVEICTPLK